MITDRLHGGGAVDKENLHGKAELRCFSRSRLTGEHSTELASIRLRRQRTSERGMGARKSFFMSCCALLSAFSATAGAEPIRVLLESDADRSDGTEIFLTSYASVGDFLASPPGVPGQFSGLNISPDYSVAGLVYDGMYRVLLESNDDRSDGTELFLASYGSFDDLVNSPPGVPGQFSGLNISPDYSVAGLAFDGMYRVLLESNDDRSDGTELFLASYSDFDALVNSPPGVPGQFSGLNISPDYSVAGLTYDGMYRVLLESNDDRSDGTELFLASYGSFDALVNSPPGVPGQFSGLNISPDYSVRGFAWEFESTISVPEPPTAALLLVGAAFLLVRRRRQSIR